MDRQKMLAMIIAGIIGLSGLTGCGSKVARDEDEKGDGTNSRSSYYGGRGMGSPSSSFSGLGSSAKGSAAS